jgi:hypothetical protein
MTDASTFGQVIAVRPECREGNRTGEGQGCERVTGAQPHTRLDLKKG